MEENNYTEFSEITEVTENNEIVENNETIEEPVQNIGDEIVEALEEGMNNVEPEFETFTVIAEENVNDIEVQNTTTIVIEPEVEEEEEEPVTDDVVPATLKGCTKLNMRKEASKDSEIVCVITKDSTITVSIGNSTEDFYKVNTIVKDVLVEGYCMKQFIKID